MIERNHDEARAGRAIADGGKSCAADALRAFHDHAAAGSGPAARGLQRLAEFVFAGDVDDPGEVGGFTVRRDRVRTQAPYAFAAATHEGEKEREGVMADDGDACRGWQVRDRHDLIDEGSRRVVGSRRQDVEHMRFLRDASDMAEGPVGIREGWTHAGIAPP
ncbi:MAG: hypothetical protein B7X63_18505 [Rhodospirillales bacterium 39-66-50]|nr:MAG: hypothetical protein B7X63_18505 [Rhodospirillales bacterium 39-66-50]